MELTSVLGILGSILGGGAVGAFITSYFNSKSEDKKTDLDATDRLIGHWEKLLQPLRDRVTHLEQELEASRIREQDYIKKINTLENQLLIFESSHIDIPLPMWMKDVSGKLIFINRLYEDSFLIPRGYTIDDYLGKYDNAVWDGDTSKQFRTNDIQVVKTKRPVRTIEEVFNDNGSKNYLDVLKYPRMLNGKVIGISGIVMGESSKKEDLLRN